MDPLDILPSELWELIFEKVEEPQDWLNLYGASPTFEGVVAQSERTRVLLQLAFPIVQKQHPSKDEEDLRQLLRLRLVSKHWKRAVDTTLEHSERPFGDVNDSYRDRDMGRKYDFCHFNRWDSAIISRFLARFGTHPGNPFIGRRARFSFHLGISEERRMGLRTSVQRLMGRFGNEIRALSITGYGGIDSPNNLDPFVDEVRSCVGLAPNLESLSVRFVPGISATLRLGAWPNLGNGGPLPIISKLKSFCFVDGDGGDPERLVDLQNLLVRLCCNPATLKTAELIGVPHELTTFPNLETASVVIIATRGEEDVSNLMSSSWPLLTRLTLCRRGPSFVPLGDVIAQCAQHFKATLTHLWIGRQCSAVQRRLEISLNLPRLKCLVIHLRLVSVQLLTSLPSLEEARLFEHTPFFNETGAKEGFAPVETQLMDQIWEGLPKLNKLEMVGSHLDGNRLRHFSRKSISRVYYRK